VFYSLKRIVESHILLTNVCLFQYKLQATKPGERVLVSRVLKLIHKQGQTGTTGIKADRQTQPSKKDEQLRRQTRIDRQTKTVVDNEACCRVQMHTYDRQLLNGKRMMDLFKALNESSF